MWLGVEGFISLQSYWLKDMFRIYNATNFKGQNEYFFGYMVYVL